MQAGGVRQPTAGLPSMCLCQRMQPFLVFSIPHFVFPNTPEINQHDVTGEVGVVLRQQWQLLPHQFMPERDPDEADPRAVSQAQAGRL